VIVEDWIKEAANELSPDVEESSITRSIYNIIRSWCPFNPDVVYMKVPRCDSCAHWKRGEIPVIKQPSHGGTCLNPELRAFDANQTIETAADFGCVQWEGEKS
jgi:hypothetical protein